MLAAAVAAIKRSGPAVTMDEIAAEAGVAKPILYRVFRDKAELYRSVGSDVAEQLLVPALVAELSRPREPRQYVAAMVDTYLAVIDSEPQLYRFVVHPALDERPAGADLVGTYKDVIARHIAGVIRTALPAERRSSGVADTWARALVGMVHEAGDWWIEHRSIARAELTEQLTALIWAGVSRALQPPPPG
jgi:AcrR family transcriptional regulator